MEFKVFYKGSKWSDHELEEIKMRVRSDRWEPGLESKLKLSATEEVQRKQSKHCEHWKLLPQWEEIMPQKLEATQKKRLIVYKIIPEMSFFPPVAESYPPFSYSSHLTSQIALTWGRWWCLQIESMASVTPAKATLMLEAGIFCWEKQLRRKRTNYPKKIARVSWYYILGITYRFQRWINDPGKVSVFVKPELYWKETDNKHI